MKKTFLHNLKINFSFLLLLLTSSCTLPKMLKLSQQQKITVQPIILEAAGDNILFEIKAQIPPKMITKKAVYSLDLVYRYGLNQEDKLGRLIFTPGEFVYENKIPTINRQFSFPYTSQKNPGTLAIQGLASTLKGREKRTKWNPIAQGLITTSKLTVRNNQINFVPDNFKPSSGAESIFKFFFDKGETQLRDFLGTNVSVLSKFIDTHPQIKSVEIYAGASPESEEAQNMQLASKRVQVLQNFLKQNLVANSQEDNLKNIEFRNTAQPQNWSLFVGKIQNAALPENDIQQILEIINGKGTISEKEAELKKLESYEYLELYVYPVLRFAEVKIDYTPAVKKDYEIYLLSKKLLEDKVERDVLTEEELRYAATLTPLLLEKQKIYERAIQYSEHWEPYHNLGIVYVKLAQLEVKKVVKDELMQKAIRNLTFASHRNPTSEMFYHLALAQHQKGNMLEALQAYDYAIKMAGSKESLQKIFSDKAALEIEIGQLDDALSSLRYAGESYQNYINKGLCYLLKENYDQAPNFYDAALKLKPEDALAHYSKAIIAARLKDENMVAYNLKKAVLSDKTFTKQAIEDLEFRDYVRKDTFTAAIK